MDGRVATGPGWFRTAAMVLTAVVVGSMTAGIVTQPVGSEEARHTSQLRAPKTSTTQDARYLSHVAEADSDLVTYVNKYGNGALQGMLTDGLAFCAFLRRGGGIDNALVNEVTGARADEKRTHLPLNVHTFNTLESFALIDLCPSEQRLVPSSVRTELGQLSGALKSQSPPP